MSIFLVFERESAVSTYVSLRRTARADAERYTVGKKPSNKLRVTLESATQQRIVRECGPKPENFEIAASMVAIRRYIVASIVEDFDGYATARSNG